MKNMYSILICTTGKDIRLLKRCILSALSLFPQKYEILIVHQGETPILENIKELTVRENVRYLFIKEYGLSHARNVGISLCKGEYIIFIDDDAYFDDKYLLNLEEILNKINFDGIAGIVLNEDTKEPLGRTIVNVGLQRLTYRDFNQWMSSATVVKKKEIIRVGKYDTNFGTGGGKYGGSEDTDLFFRLINSGCSLLFSNRLIVFHPGSKKLTSLSKKKIFLKGFHYGIGRTAVFRKFSYISKKKTFSFLVWIESVSMAIAASIVSLTKLDFNQFIFDVGSFFGRLIGFLIYNQESN